TQQGYLLPCFQPGDIAAARERMAMQVSLGLQVRWLQPGEVDQACPALAPGCTLGATYCEQDGYLRPPRNVVAYAVALATSGVQVRERVSCTGLTARGDTVDVDTSAGPLN